MSGQLDMQVLENYIKTFDLFNYRVHHLRFEYSNKVVEQMKTLRYIHMKTNCVIKALRDLQQCHDTAILHVIQRNMSEDLPAIHEKIKDVHDNWVGKYRSYLPTTGFLDPTLGPNLGSTEGAYFTTVTPEHGAPIDVLQTIEQLMIDLGVDYMHVGDDRDAGVPSAVRGVDGGLGSLLEKLGRQY